jgi:hypothetical protein
MQTIFYYQLKFLVTEAFYEPIRIPPNGIHNQLKLHEIMNLYTQLDKYPTDFKFLALLSSSVTLFISILKAPRNRQNFR